MCAAESLQKAKSRLPPWGRWTRVSEDGEGEVPAAPSHGLCGSAGGLPSQSPNGDSSPEGGAKLVHNQKFAESQVSPPPLGEVPRRGRRGQPAPGAHVRWPLDEHERSELPWARIDSGGTPPFGKGASLFP